MSVILSNNFYTRSPIHITEVEMCEKKFNHWLIKYSHKNYINICFTEQAARSSSMVAMERIHLLVEVFGGTAHSHTFVCVRVCCVGLLYECMSVMSACESVCVSIDSAKQMDANGHEKTNGTME